MDYKLTTPQRIWLTGMFLGSLAACGMMIYAYLFAGADRVFLLMGACLSLGTAYSAIYWIPKYILKLGKEER